MRNVINYVVAIAIAAFTIGARAMTPGSMLGVCFVDGKCTTIDGERFGAIVAKLEANDTLANVRQIDLTGLKDDVTTADVVRTFDKLEKLSLRNASADLAPLIGYAALRTLAVRQLPQSAIASLAKLTQLEALELPDGAFTTLGDLSALTKLTRVELNGGKITSLAGLAKNTLTQLSVGRTKLTDLKPLYAMKTLQNLRINETPIHDLQPLAALTALTAIDAMASKVADVTPLAKLSKLRDLNLEGTRVKSLKPLHDCKALAFVSLAKGAVPATDVAAFQKAVPDCRVTF